MNFFDTHCHLNHSSFVEDMDSVIDSARLAGVNFIIVPGWDCESSQRAIELAENYPQIYAAVGIHPTEWEKVNPKQIKTIQSLVEHPKVVAVGEIGLDYYHQPSNKEMQKYLLQEMLEIAFQSQKPVILHSRESMADILVLIKEWLGPAYSDSKLLGVFHAFEGNIDQAYESIEMGFSLGVGGPLTYKNAATKKEVFSLIPAESILLETDSPYLAPVPHRGERNEPAFLNCVSPVLAQIRNTNELDLTEQILTNSYKMFLQDRAN